MKGSVIWITGLSGAGKSTLAIEVVNRLRKQGHSVVLLDGDELREVFGAAAINAKNHAREGRLTLAFQYAHLCQIIARQGIQVVIATISLFKEIHLWNRANLPGYFEIYLKVPVDELRRRDPKGIYRRFDAGEIADVSGLDIPIDEPHEADWIYEYRPKMSIKELADELMNKIKEREFNGN